MKIERIEAESAVCVLLRYIGEDARDERVHETPTRYAKALLELTSGYSQNVELLMKTFACEEYDEMVVLKGVEFVSMCEHHMLPFEGVAHIAYLPNGRVLGVSKLPRLLEAYSRRLQLQERIAAQVVGALMEHLKPLGAACVLEASHSCMSCRGVKKRANMITSKLDGVFKTDPTVRAEFFSLIRR